MLRRRRETPEETTYSRERSVAPQPARGLEGARRTPPPGGPARFFLTGGAAAGVRPAAQSTAEYTHIANVICQYHPVQLRTHTDQANLTFGLSKQFKPYSGSQPPARRFPARSPAGQKQRTPSLHPVAHTPAHQEPPSPVGLHRHSQRTGTSCHTSRGPSLVTSTQPAPTLHHQHCQCSFNLLLLPTHQAYSFPQTASIGVTVSLPATAIPRPKSAVQTLSPFLPTPPNSFLLRHHFSASATPLQLLVSERRTRQECLRPCSARFVVRPFFGEIELTIKHQHGHRESHRSKTPQSGNFPRDLLCRYIRVSPQPNAGLF